MKVSSPPGVAWFRQSFPLGALVRHCAWGSPWFSVSSQQQPPSPGTNAQGPSHAISIGSGPEEELLVTSPVDEEVAVEPVDVAGVLVALDVVESPPDPRPPVPPEMVPLEPPPPEAPAKGASKS